MRIIVFAWLWLGFCALAAADTEWTNVGTGNWAAAGNWTAGVPTAADSAIINTGGTAVIQPPTAAEADEVWVAVHTDSRVDVINATLDAGMVSLATQPSGSGWMHVSGPGAQVDVAGDFMVGRSGAGRVDALDGATVQANRMLLGQFASAFGTLQAGAGSQLTTSDALVVGWDGGGSAVFTNGGSAALDRLVVGARPGSAGELEVLGSPSQVLVDGAVTVGGQGTGSLTVFSGALLRSQDGVVGEAVGGQGSVRVLGSGSHWDVLAAALDVGVAGPATLRLVNGGLVSIAGGPGVLRLATQPGSQGVVVFEGPAPGRLNAVQIIGGAGTARVDFMQAGDLLLQASPGNPIAVRGTTALHHLSSGTTTLLADSDTTGSTQISIGTLRVNAALLHSPVTVDPGATLSGDGSLGGGAVVQGTLAPGDGVGSLALSSLQLGAMATLAMQFNQPDGFHDHVTVANDLVLDGTLVVSGPAPASDVERLPIASYGGALVDQGLVLAALPAGWHPHWVVDTTVAGQVALRAQGTLAFDPAPLDAGAQRVGTTSAAHAVALSNPGQGTVSILAIDPPGDAAFQPAGGTCVAPMQLPPGGTCTLLYRFSPEFLGMVSTSVTVHSDASNAGATLGLVGEGAEPLPSLSPGVVDFGGVVVGEHADAALQLSNAGAVPLQVNAVRAPDAPFGVQGSCPSAPFALGAAQSCTLVLRFAPLAGEASAGVLTVEHDAAGPALEAALQGLGLAARAQATPPLLDFAHQQVDAPSEVLAFSIHNTGTLALELGTGAIDYGREFLLVEDACSGATLAPGGQCSGGVLFHPVAPGFACDRLSYPGNAPEGDTSMLLAGQGSFEPVFSDGFEAPGDGLRGLAAGSACAVLPAAADN